MTGNSKKNSYEGMELCGAGTTVIRPGGFQLTDEMIASCGFHPGDRVLDVGCGSGGTVAYLRSEFGFDAMGLDISEELLMSGHKRFPELFLLHGSGDSLPFQEGSFQGVLSECSLSLMPDMEKALSEMYRVLVPGGKLAISDLYLRQEHSADKLRGRVTKGCLSGARTRSELAETLEGFGFSICRWEDRTDTWKRYIAGLILQGCDMETIWDAGIGTGMDPQTASLISQAKPGYFWMTARKNY